jgi:RNA polymerase sigma-70 factor (ECF subfamily)
LNRFVKIILPVKIKYSEEELVGHLLSKDATRFEAVYDHFSASLYSIIKQIVNSDELAQDLLQESFLKIWNNAASYNPEKSRLFTWVLNIARNTAIDYLRSKQGKMETKNQSRDSFVHIIENGEPTTQFHDHIGLKKIVDQLKDDQKEIIDLAFFEGYTQDEIAKKLQMPLGTVKTRSRAAIQILRKALS